MATDQKVAGSNPITTKLLLFCQTNSYLLDELLTQCAGRSEVLLLQGHVFFGLRVEAGVLDQAVHKQPHVVLHLKDTWTPATSDQALMQIKYVC